MSLLPRYENYKESGVEWLGEIPGHWNLIKSKYIWDEVEERTKTGNETLLSVSQYHGIHPRKSDSRSENLVDYKACSPGDLVINIMLAWMGGLGISPYNGIVSPAYCIYRTKTEVVPQYLGYLYRTSQYLAEFARRSKGIVPSRWRMYTEDFGQVLTLLPPENEQICIANFLDQKTAEIDEAITKKEQLITLLQEQKAILINQAVTKGLNPKAPMKDSGVAWLGEIPATWNTKKVKYLFKQSRLPVSAQDGVVTAFRDGQVTLRTNRRTDGFTIAILEHGYQGVKIGQLVINSMDAFAGAIGVSESSGKCSPEYVACDPVDKKEVDPMYYALLLREMALKGYITVICPAVRQRALRLRYNNLAVIYLPVPNFKEQIKITKFVEDVSHKVNQLISQLTTELEIITELKNVIISEVVTGKQAI